MLDFFHLINNETNPNVDVQLFTGRLQSSSASLPSFGDAQIWKRPRGITMIHFLTVSGGGSGGGGGSAAAGTSKGGGGGGAPGSIAMMIVPAMFLPDKLYIFPGSGGNSVGAQVAGIGGGNTLIAVLPDPNFNTANLLIMTATSGAVAGGGGAAGAGFGGAGGSAAGAGSLTNGRWGQQFAMGNAFFGGNTGGAGSTSGNGGAVSFLFGSQYIVGGSGGGGSTSSANGTGGGTSGISGSGNFVNPLTEAIPVAAAAASPGSGGYLISRPDCPWFVFGGMGAGGVDNAVGSAGGNGAWGSGGGGGGSGTTGGAGGAGGPGFVVVTSW